MIYVYAFCPNPDTSLMMPEGILQPVQLVTVEQLGAIAEYDVDVAPMKENDVQLMNAVLAHDRVLGDMFSQVPLLPLRFGTQFKDAAALESFLESHAETYRERLATLQDKAEYLLKLSPKLPEIVTFENSLKGRDYFLAKKQRLQAQAQTQADQQAEFQQFIEFLEKASIPFVQSPPQEEAERLHLLLSRDAEHTHSCITEWQHQLPNWQLHCSEPLPPYHFAT